MKKTEKKHTPYGIYERFFKRPLDILCGLAAVIVFSWLYIILAILVRIKLGSPIFFTQERPGKDEKIMRLDPGMAFGTGSHATTRMCLELMDVEGKDVIDVGCGSGILGIAAKICGAKSVYMCDIDAQAVEFATKNAELNNVVATIEKADLLEGEQQADFIFANITADILMRFSKSIGKHLRENGTIVL